MVKSIRKYNKWFMAGFGVLLMMTWLVGPATKSIGEVKGNKRIGRLDGRGVTSQQFNNASKELEALTAFASFMTRGLFGIEDRDTTHWLILSHEAEQGGYVGDVQDGQDFADQVADAVVQQQMQRDFQLMLQIYNSKDPAGERKRIAEAFKNNLPAIYRMNGLTPDEGERAMAKAHGIFRMMNAYQRAARVSDRLAATEARENRDAALVDYVFIPASLSADQTPDPTPEALQVHFDKYKTVKPGEGEYGIGYLFPARVKLEWLKLDRAAFEKAVTLDPVEVRKRFTQNHPAKYPGEFAAERANVEKDMLAEAADKALQDAQLAIHAEVLKATKTLDSDGKFKIVPKDWEARKPRLEAIAQAVVDQLKQSSLSIPLPDVEVKGNTWYTMEELSQIPALGQAVVKQGGLTISLPQLVSLTKEFPGALVEQAPIQIQTGITVAEHPLTDNLGNRYFITILATRPESAPDNVDERRDQIVKDYKLIQAFQTLKGKADELRQVALGGGLDAVIAAVQPPKAADPAKPDDKADPKADPKADKDKLEVKKQAAINRESSGGDPHLDDPDLRKALLAAASQLDPMAPYGSIAADTATVVIPTAKRLGVAVFRIQAYSPVTFEAYRTADSQIVGNRQKVELKTEEKDNPFTLANLLKRHTYLSGEKHIQSADDLKKDKSEG